MQRNAQCLFSSHQHPPRPTNRYMILHIQPPPCIPSCSKRCKWGWLITSAPNLVHTAPTTVVFQTPCQSLSAKKHDTPGPPYKTPYSLSLPSDDSPNHAVSMRMGTDSEVTSESQPGEEIFLTASSSVSLYSHPGLYIYGCTSASFTSSGCSFVHHPVVAEVLPGSLDCFASSVGETITLRRRRKTESSMCDVMMCTEKMKQQGRSKVYSGRPWQRLQHHAKPACYHQS